MKTDDILVPAAVMALLRREQSVGGVADRFGVTEAQVLEWQDIFVVAGVLALKECQCPQGFEVGPGHTTTTPLAAEPPVEYPQKR